MTGVCSLLFNSNIVSCLCHRDLGLALDRLAWLHEYGGLGDVLLFFVALWQIWTLHNHVMFHGGSLSVPLIVNSIQSVTKELEGIRGSIVDVARGQWQAMHLQDGCVRLHMLCLCLVMLGVGRWGRGFGIGIVTPRLRLLYLNIR